ncbi:carbohydrate-binding protein [Isoptericola sp. NEAU-Y5]|uniref:chitinase n=1 Tax=Isoptericola luteus TaxID=2879484 RepID=A0ABS7ZHK7_9MICO|nr:glycosyl hydrolase family 18 protein [Isoptericola sp. NEAU-Y5]MCA5894403.1 carbohydrate-binding protein [Isoptericola sp. NEAU-Y5]
MDQHTQSARRPRRRRLVAGLAALAVAVTGAVGAVAATQSASAAEATNPGDSSINGYRNVGYFTQWGVYGRGFQVKDLVDSGAAEQLTHINYAFGNIHHQTLTCFEANKAQGSGPNGSDGAGDAWADYGMSYTAATSVAGVADTWDQPMAGSFNQLKQLKDAYPHLKVMLSLGGWTWSKNFSRAAATDASRQAFVSSCIDLYIKGNLPVIDGRGGAGAAAGVFDGFDIDWEWPGSLNGAEGNHVDQANDARNFKLLLAEFREQLDAYGATTGEDYLLSAFLPANPDDIAAGGWNDPAIFDSLDYGNVQGYDLHGAWDATLTGHQINLYDDPADPRPAARQFSVDKAVQEYVGAGIDPAQLGLGMAMYGRGWTGATQAAPWGPATGAAPATYEAGIEDYDVLKSVGTGTYDAAVGAAWRYDGTRWWSLDTPQTVTQKSAYIRSQGLGGAMWWDLSGDEPGELLDAVEAGLFTGTPGPVDPGEPTPDPTDPTPDPTDPTPDPTEPTPDPGDCAVAAWDAGAVYTGGNVVSHEGHEWRAKWWTTGEEPGTTGEWGVWADEGAC